MKIEGQTWTNDEYKIVLRLRRTLFTNWYKIKADDLPNDLSFAEKLRILDYCIQGDGKKYKLDKSALVKLGATFVEKQDHKIKEIQEIREYIAANNGNVTNVVEVEKSKSNQEKIDMQYIKKHIEDSENIIKQKKDDVVEMKKNTPNQNKNNMKDEDSVLKTRKIEKKNSNI